MNDDITREPNRRRRGMDVRDVLLIAVLIIVIWLLVLAL
jgi:hypothetical protein